MVFEKKLDDLCKLVRERKNIGIDLIDILDNESAIQEIHNRAEKQLLKALSSYSNFILSIDGEIIVVSLVLIAMLEYDGNYYSSVCSTYIDVYKKYSKQKIEGLIRTILGRYKKQLDPVSRDRIINIVLENAIVPKAFLSAFFEFIFDIYKLNFEYDLPKEPYEDFKFVFEGLRDNMLFDENNISIHVTRKTYKLIQSTKQLIIQGDSLDSIIQLSIIIIKLIDRRFWNKEVNIVNPYLKKGYEGWETTLKETMRDFYERKKNDFHSRWEPKFVFDSKFNNAIYLNPPIHRIKSQYNYEDVAVIVRNDKEEIYRNNNCNIREIIGGYQINVEGIILKKPLGKLRYMFIVGDEIIYDSKERLYRNYIVFNEEGQEINNNTDFEGTVFICYKKNEANIKSKITEKYYCIGDKIIRVGDIIEIGHDIFNFSTITKPGILGQQHSNCKVKCLEGNVLMSVYKEIRGIIFEADNTSSKFEIIINGTPRKLSEMKYKVTNKITTFKYIVELDLQESGIYIVEVNQFVSGNKNKILKENFVYDIELLYSGEMINEYKARIQVISGLFTEAIEVEVAVDDFKLDFIQFEKDGKYFNYFIPFNFGFYKVSDGKWCSPSENLWIEDIKDSAILTLYDSDCDGLLVYDESKRLVEDGIFLQDKGYYKWVPIYFLNSYKNENKYILLAFTVDGKVKYRIFCYNQCVMDKEKTEILCSNNPKQVQIIPYFHGKNKVFYELFNESNEKIYKSTLLHSGQMDIIEKFDSFIRYTIRFYEKMNKFQLRKNTPIYEVNTIFYLKQNFVGQEFKIDTVYFNQSIRGELIEKKWSFNKAYIRITDMIDLEKGIFRGIVFIETYQGKRELNNINPVDIEICSDVVDGTMDIYMTNQGDGLLFDNKKKVILNSLVHSKAPDIFLYTINLNRG